MCVHERWKGDLSQNAHDREDEKGRSPHNNGQELQCGISRTTIGGIVVCTAIIARSDLN